MDVVLTTGRRNPEITRSDALLQSELRLRGHEVSVAPWNAAPIDRFLAADLVVLRSNWDYWVDLADFETWLETVEAGSVLLANPGPLVRWNLDKRYLLELEKAGVSVPQSGVFAPSDMEGLRRWCSSRDRAVLKPAVGCSGHGVELVDNNNIEEVLGRLGSVGLGEHVIVQEFVEEVGKGELAVVFFAGRYSHAFRRVPPAGEFRVNHQFGGRSEPVEPTSTSIEAAQAALAALPYAPVYARVDLVLRGGAPIVMEIEVNEPSLCLDFCAAAPGRFADALIDYAGRR